MGSRRDREIPPPAYRFQTVNIANGQTTSDEIVLWDGIYFGIAWPAAFTGATVTIQVSHTAGGAYQALVDSAGAAHPTLTVAGFLGKSMSFVDAFRVLLAPWQFMKIVSASAEGAARVLIVTSKGGR